MNVYLIRHGETYGNRDHFHQGWSDVSLTEDGINQAKLLGRAISASGIRFDRFISSDVHRVKQTAALIFEGGEGIEYEYDTRLREVDNTSIAGIRGEDMYKKYGESYRESSRRLEYTAYGGESAASLFSRVSEFLKCLEEDGESENIAVLTHGGVIHAALAWVLHMPLYVPLLQIDNCSITKLFYRGQKDNLPSWQVRFMNIRPSRDGGSFAF